MKYYESASNEYIQAAKQFDLHPELAEKRNAIPASITQLGNMIFYGPSGSGKYTQFLRFIERYSSNRLKTEKMSVQTEKQSYDYHISDVHYEIDMALLGCESKKLWNDSFFQIIDVVSAKKIKSGIICCHNFHNIHSELLDIFYSYMQHCRTLSIHIAFVLLTEHVSFIPNRILQCCKIIPVKRPAPELYKGLVDYQSRFYSGLGSTNKEFAKNIGLLPLSFLAKPKFDTAEFQPESIPNLKEMRAYIRSQKKDGVMAKDVFNIVCDNIIQEMLKHETTKLIDLRDHLYDILLYGLDITECLWYILAFFVDQGHDLDLSEILDKTNSFLKYYNNNYRPIYHLESIFIYLITKIYHYPIIADEP